MALIIDLEYAVGAGDFVCPVVYFYTDADGEKRPLHGHLVLANYNPYMMRGTLFLVLDRVARCFSMPVRHGLKITNMAGSVELDLDKIQADFTAKVQKRLKLV
jgi:hypothetical protein